MIILTQVVWPKSYFNKYTDVNKAKTGFKEYCFKFIKQEVFEKSLNDLKNHRDIRLVTTRVRKLYYVRIKQSHKKLFSQNLLVIEIKKANIHE